MNRYFKLSSLILFYLCLYFPISAQILEPVKWNFHVEKISDTESWLVHTARIDKGWTVYSQYLESEDGPVATYIEYENLDGVELVGKSIEEGHKKDGFDKIFKVNVAKFLSDQNYVIKQKVKTTQGDFSATGFLEFMTCNDEKCLPPSAIDFSFNGNESVDISSNKIAEKPSKLSPNIEANNLEKAVGASNNEVVKWDFKIRKEGKNYNIIATADIEAPWQIYSYYTEAGGPIPTLISFENEENLKLFDDPIETGHKKEGKDPLFDNANVIKFLSDQPYSLTQKIKPNKSQKTLQGYLTYMACNSTVCTPPTDVDFAFDLESLTYIEPNSLANLSEIPNPIAEVNVVDQTREEIVSSLSKPLGACGGTDHTQKNSVFWMFIFGFLGGLVALLTPCVFPMIPLTVSYFTKDTKRKGWVNGAIYGLSIIVIYVAIGLGLTIFFGEEALNRLSTNWIANTIFFLVFILFAFSFFGFYEIQLPSSWANKSDRIADRGGYLGIFFMAFTLALVSFSCTGPIIGSAIVQAASNQVGPFVVMLGFSTALALPFGFFAAFPAWLNTLPKSGSWMNSVKVVLGFLELALALKFLSVADMTNHWGFLRYELFMGLWVLIFAGMTLYLFGFIKFPHDSPLKKLSKPRWLFAFASLAFTLYLTTGFFINQQTQSYNALKAMSGLAPPTTYNYLLTPPSVPQEILDRYPSYGKCANNINCFKDYFEGLAYAKEIGKPILIDMTGHGCVNCRKTEEHIWIDSDIRNKLENEFVMISLYVDDDKKLDEVLISKKRQKKLRNVGNKWADFQIVNFQQNSQPLYIMLSPEEQILANPRGYQEGVQSYQNFLDCGLNTFKGLKDLGAN